jgi:hypothetical protein
LEAIDGIWEEGLNQSSSMDVETTTPKWHVIQVN